MESDIQDRLETNAASRMATVGLFGGTAGYERLGNCATSPISTHVSYVIQLRESIGSRTGPEKSVKNAR
jgi:hypothetical protein